MITKVWGKLDNKYDLIFGKNLVKGTWDCIIPFLPTREYIVSLYAEDDAGNTGYFATIMFSVDLKTLQARIIVMDYNTELSNETVSAILGKIKTVTSLSINEFSNRLLYNKYNTELKVEEVI